MVEDLIESIISGMEGIIIHAADSTGIEKEGIESTIYAILENIFNQTNKI